MSVAFVQVLCLATARRVFCLRVSELLHFRVISSHQAEYPNSLGCTTLFVSLSSLGLLGDTYTERQPPSDRYFMLANDIFLVSCYPTLLLGQQLQVGLRGSPHNA